MAPLNLVHYALFPGHCPVDTGHCGRALSYFILFIIITTIHLSEGCKAHAVQSTVVSIVDEKLSCPCVRTTSGIADCAFSCDRHDHKI